MPDSGQSILPNIMVTQKSVGKGIEGRGGRGKGEGNVEGERGGGEGEGEGEGEGRGVRGSGVSEKSIPAQVTDYREKWKAKTGRLQGLDWCREELFRWSQV